MKTMLTTLLCVGLLVAIPGCPIPPKPDPNPGRKLDSDGDGISDVAEKENGSDPEDCADPNPSGCPDKPGVPDDSLDSDGDGIPDADELILGSDPKDCADPFASGCSEGRDLPDDEPDSDGDGLSDDEETRVGTNPFDCADPLPAGCTDKPGPDDLCAHVTDCDDEDLCTTDACVPDVGCVNTQISCPPGQDCDPGTGSCVTSGCTSDADCDDGEVCNEGTCVLDDSQCLADADCDDGEVCNEGTCVLVDSQCLADADCDDGEVCNEGTCELDDSQCQTNADCHDDGLYCNGTEFCGADGVCSSPGDPCLADEFCNEASDTCDECRVDADCAGGGTCTNGMCVSVASECQVDSDCLTGELCDNGVCELAEGRCEADTDCDAGEVCMMSSGRRPPGARRVGWCEPPGPPCESDADCDAGEACNDGVCGPECHIDTDCTDMNSCNIDACVDKVCVHTPIVCDELGNCTVCPPGGFCYSVPMDCAEGTEFNPVSCHCEPPLPCMSDAYCDAGEVCNNGVCEPAGSECAVDSDCYDDAFCNGLERCEAGTCVAGEGPCEQTGFTCNEVTDACQCSADSQCDDGLFCNGAEACRLGACVSGTPRCGGTLTCDEELQRCVSNSGNGCNDCDDGNVCTNDACVNNQCVHTSISCDDGLFCNGVETCDPVGGCRLGTDPCPGTACTESGGCAGSATLRVVNNTHYAMIDIQLNGQQMVAYPNGILPGGSYDFEFSSPGSVDFYFAVGFYDSNGNRDPWFFLPGSTTVTVGQTVEAVFDNPTIGQFLSGFDQSGRDWVGAYYCVADNCRNTYNEARFHFGYDGSWELYDNGSLVGSGSVILTSWPDNATCISFKFFSNGEEISMCYPFGIFYYQNGPSYWSIIEYVAQ